MGAKSSTQITTDVFLLACSNFQVSRQRQVFYLRCFPKICFANVVEWKVKCAGSVGKAKGWLLERAVMVELFANGMSGHTVRWQVRSGYLKSNVEKSRHACGLKGRLVAGAALQTFKTNGELEAPCRRGRRRDPTTPCSGVMYSCTMLLSICDNPFVY